MRHEQFKSAVRLIFGYTYFREMGHDHFPEKGFDGRRRTTKLIRMFNQFANQAALCHAALLIGSYCILIHFFITPFIPDSIAHFFDHETGAKHFFTIFRVWLSAQISLLTMTQIHKRLIPIVVDDHYEPCGY